MKVNKKKSFSTKLTIYIISVCAAIYVIIFIMLYVIPKISQYKTVVTYAGMITEKVSERISEQGKNIERVNSMFKLEPMKNLLISEDTSLYVQVLKNTPELCGLAMEFAPEYRDYDIYVYQNNNRILVKKLNHSEKHFSDERLHAQTLQKKGSYWSRHYSDTLFVKQRIFSRYEPIYNAAQTFIGYLRLDVPIKEFTKFVRDLKLYQTGYCYLLNQEGIILSHPNQEIKRYANIWQYAKAKNIDYDKIINRIVKGEDGTDKLTVEGKNFFIHFKRLPHTNWSLVTLCPFNEVYNSISNISDLILIGCFICLLLLFWIIIRIIRQVFKPLRQFATVTRTIADGNFNVPIPETNDNDELRELRNSFMYMQHRIIESIKNLKKTTMEKEKFESEIRVAQNIQEQFLPTSNKLDKEHISLYSVLEQSKAVGGDMYSYLVKNDLLYFTVGDVRGKGVPAALYMASVCTLFNYMATSKQSSASICNTLNDYLCSNLNEDMFITMFVGILNLKTGLLNYTNAGHPYPIVQREQRENSMFLEEALDIPIGIMKNVYKDTHLQLYPGDTLLIYTDGISEAQNEARAFYGKERLLQFVKTLQTRTPEELIDEILADLINYIGDMDEADDLTMLSIKYLKNDQIIYF
ncbi:MULTISPECIES: SpoIIE family protein phosphatase [Porphyromonadaceae]|uniref:SpoIIE family protein phosphatase n=1 Tax=Porphyromonadaceae TaxID=171551 RepID=UPI0005A1FB22|nr:MULTISPECIES: SpoIIE family protein phosphatase [Porphyromonadaceae]PXZ45267.1 HAMP domain-containing protein [Sanguibacteroides justesenii]